MRLFFDGIERLSLAAGVESLSPIKPISWNVQTLRVERELTSPSRQELRPLPLDAPLWTP